MAKAVDAHEDDEAACMVAGDCAGADGEVAMVQHMTMIKQLVLLLLIVGQLLRLTNVSGIFTLGNTVHQKQKKL